VNLEAIQNPPPLLRSLFDGTHPQSRHFIRNIRAYNSALAFTSCSAKPDTRLNYTAGIRTFQIQGALFHYQGSLRESGEDPQFAQLYFYDTDYANRIRHERCGGLDIQLLGELTEMLEYCNPFITIYRTAKERLSDEPLEYRLLLNPQMRLVMETGIYSLLLNCKYSY
jgi:hypothetical protein